VRISIQSKFLLITLALLVLGVIAYDVLRHPLETPLPEPVVAVMAPPPEVRRGLDKTPLLYTGEYLENLASRLAPALVFALPVDAGPVPAVPGIVISDRGDMLIPLQGAIPRWRIGATDGPEASLVAIDAVHGVGVLQADSRGPGRVLEIARPAIRPPGEPLVGLRAGVSGPVIRLMASPGPAEALVSRLAAERLPAGEAVVDLDGQLVAFVGLADGRELPLSGDLVREIAAALIVTGRHRHPWIGLTLQTVDGRLETYFPGAALVAVEVSPDSAAARAGIQPGMGFEAVRAGDRIVQRAEDVPALLAVSARVELVAAPPLRRLFELDVADLQEPLSESTAAGIKGRRDENGVPIVVAASGHAAAYGLRTGDVIEAIDRQPARSVAQVERALDGRLERLLLVRRKGDRFFLVLPALTEAG
jgi:hypothetical protein